MRSERGKERESVSLIVLFSFLFYMSVLSPFLPLFRVAPPNAAALALRHCARQPRRSRGALAVRQSPVHPGFTFSFFPPRFVPPLFPLSAAVPPAALPPSLFRGLTVGVADKLDGGGGARRAVEGEAAVARQLERAAHVVHALGHKRREGLLGAHVRHLGVAAGERRRHVLPVVGLGARAGGREASA